jgi:hypothetical protein
MYSNYLSGYCKCKPTVKNVGYTIENKKRNMNLARPVKKWEDINDKKKYDFPNTKRKIRSEDINIRNRSIDDDAQGRLTDFETAEMTRKINEDANKYARIGEKVLTKLFKVEVPDSSDVEYINKRSEIMSGLRLTKEEADEYLKENFREQFKTVKPVDLARMNAPVNVMLSAFKQYVESGKRTDEDRGKMKNLLNNILIKEGVRNVDDIKDVIKILIREPYYRVAYKEESPFKILGILSNIVVGNSPQEEDVNLELKQVDPQLGYKLENKFGGMDRITDEINKMKRGIKQRLDNERDNNQNVDIDNIVEDKVPLGESSGEPFFFEQKTELEEKEDKPYYLDTIKSIILGAYNTLDKQQLKGVITKEKAKERLEQMIMTNIPVPVRTPEEMAKILKDLEPDLKEIEERNQKEFKNATETIQASIRTKIAQLDFQKKMKERQNKSWTKEMNELKKLAKENNINYDESLNDDELWNEIIKNFDLFGDEVEQIVDEIVEKEGEAKPAPTPEAKPVKPVKQGPVPAFNKDDEMIDFIKAYLKSEITKSKMTKKKKDTLFEIIDKEDERKVEDGKLKLKNPATYFRDILDKDVELNKSKN